MQFEWLPDKHIGWCIRAYGHEDEVDHICEIVKKCEGAWKIHMTRADGTETEVPVCEVVARYNARPRKRRGIDTRRRNGELNYGPGKKPHVVLRVGWKSKDGAKGFVKPDRDRGINPNPTLGDLKHENERKLREAMKARGQSTDETDVHDLREMGRREALKQAKAEGWNTEGSGYMRPPEPDKKKKS